MLRAFVKPNNGPEGTTHVSKQTHGNSDTTATIALQRCQSFLNADDGDPTGSRAVLPPSGRFLHPATRSPLPPSHFVLRKSTCVLLPPLGRWQEPVGWRCSQPHICHIMAGDGVRAPSADPVTSLTDTSGWGRLSCPARPTPAHHPPPVGRKAGLLRGVGGFLAESDGTVALLWAFLFFRGTEVLSH